MVGGVSGYTALKNYETALKVNVKLTKNAQDIAKQQSNQILNMIKSADISGKGQKVDVVA